MINRKSVRFNTTFIAIKSKFFFFADNAETLRNLLCLIAKNKYLSLN